MSQYQIIRKDDYFLLDFQIQVELETVQLAYAELLSHPQFTQTSNTLWDFEDTIVALSIPDMHKMADAVTSASLKRAESAKSAFVVSDDNDARLLQNYITMVSHYPVEFRMFSCYELAEIWLSER